MPLKRSREAPENAGIRQAQQQQLPLLLLLVLFLKRRQQLLPQWRSFLRGFCL